MLELPLGVGSHSRLVFFVDRFWTREISVQGFHSEWLREFGFGISQFDTILIRDGDDIRYRDLTIVSVERRSNQMSVHARI